MSLVARFEMLAQKCLLSFLEIIFLSWMQLMGNNPLRWSICTKFCKSTKSQIKLMHTDFLTYCFYWCFFYFSCICVTVEYFLSFFMLDLPALTISMTDHSAVLPSLPIYDCLNMESTDDLCCKLAFIPSLEEAWPSPFS